MTRGVFQSLVIIPKFRSPTVLSGWANHVRLNALNISHRNCRRYRSRIGKFFIIAKSTLLNCGFLKRFRAVLPNVPGGLAVNAAVLKYSFIHWLLGPCCTLNGWPGT